MPTPAQKKITVVLEPSGATVVYWVTEADFGTIVEGNVLMFRGKKDGETTVKKYGIKAYRTYDIEDIPAS